MSKCEDIRPLLAELVYGEVDPDAAEMLKEHLGSCLPCRRYQMAFEAVREDLQEWTPAAADGSRGITFITPAAHARPSIFSHPAVRGLAVAASFVLGVFLMAAAVNLQIHSDASGWSVSTSLWSTPAPAVEPASVANPGRLYDLATDPGELSDLSAREPEVFEELLEAYRRGLGVNAGS